MLFWLFVIILVAGIGLIALGDKMGGYYWKNHSNNFLTKLCGFDDEVIFCGALTIAISVLVLVIMLLIIIGSHINVDAQVERNKECYKALEYKVTSGACRDELGLLSKEVIDEVQKWNEDIKYYQEAQDDFWVGIFHPNVFDQFETIDYEKYNTGE